MLDISTLPVDEIRFSTSVAALTMSNCIRSDGAELVVIVEGVSDGCLLGATVSVGLDVGMCVGTVDIVGDDVCACTI